MSAGDLRQGRCVTGESVRRALVNSRLMDSKPSKGADCSSIAGRESAPKSALNRWLKSAVQVAGVCPKMQKALNSRLRWLSSTEPTPGWTTSHTPNKQ